MQLAPDPILALVMTIPFLVTFAALNFILFKPLVAYLDQRDAAKHDAEHEAEHLAHEIEHRNKDVEQQLEKALADVATLRANLRSNAQVEESTILGSAREAAEGRVNAALAELATAREAGRAALRSQATTLSSDIAAQVLGRDVTT